MPAFSLLLGAVVLGAFWIGGDPWTGVRSFGVFVALAALILLGSRSETLRGLSGPGRDERWAMIDLTATSFAGHALLLAVGILWLAEIARGHDGMPYGGLLALAGGAYVVGVAWGRFRR